MSKRKPMDKAQLRQRRDQMLAAAAAGLSITEGVREMRAIAGMTQEEFARHREVSARVIKAIELGQGNPTLATLNRIGQFFGLEVAFVPIRRSQAENQPPMAGDLFHTPDDINAVLSPDLMHKASAIKQSIAESLVALDKALAAINKLNANNVAEEPVRTKSKPRSSGT